MDNLKEYEAKRAILLAAGFGSRMVPITLNTPKPLVRVNGKRIIQSSVTWRKKPGVMLPAISPLYMGNGCVVVI